MVVTQSRGAHPQKIPWAEKPVPVRFRPGLRRENERICPARLQMMIFIKKRTMIVKVGRQSHKQLGVQDGLDFRLPMVMQSCCSKNLCGVDGSTPNRGRQRFEAFQRVWGSRIWEYRYPAAAFRLRSDVRSSYLVSSKGMFLFADISHTLNKGNGRGVMSPSDIEPNETHLLGRQVSGQNGLTVNQVPGGFGGSNPSLPTEKMNGEDKDFIKLVIFSYLYRQFLHRIHNGHFRLSPDASSEVN